MENKYENNKIDPNGVEEAVKLWEYIKKEIPTALSEEKLEQKPLGFYLIFGNRDGIWTFGRNFLRSWILQEYLEMISNLEVKKT